MLYSRNTGDARLHPQDPHIVRGIGFASPTGGVVDLSRVPVGKLTRRVERQDWPSLKAEIKRKSRHRNR
jgi:hypothetical protein